MEKLELITEVLENGVIQREPNAREIREKINEIILKVNELEKFQEGKFSKV